MGEDGASMSYSGGTTVAGSLNVLDSRELLGGTKSANRGSAQFARGL